VSRENVELFWRSLTAFSGPDVNGYLAVCDPDVEGHAISAEAEGSVHRRHEGVRRWWENMELTFGDSLHAGPSKG
jgi:ketosteroid isomerase-like protein